MATFTSNGSRIHYEVFGDDRRVAPQGDAVPIVLTHGAMMDLQQWQPQFATLAEQRMVVAWDVRGHGESTLPAGAVDAEDFSKDLVALLDHLGIARALLVGLSMGGHISLQTAVRFPERVAGLVLIGTPYTNSFNWFERVTAPLNRATVRLLPYSWTISMTASAVSHAESDNRTYAESAFRSIPKERFLRLWNAVLGMESGGDLSRIDCPVLVLLGDRDRLVARQQSSLVAGIRGARMETIADAGHLTNRDNPAAVNRAILAFADSIDLSGNKGYNTPAS